MSQVKLNLPDTLKKRGIQHAANEAGWEEYTYYGMQGWRYPIYNVKGDQHTLDGAPVYRWKNADSDNSLQSDHWQKCAWIPGKTERARYYLFSDTLKAIEDEWGACYLASGEPDVLAYRAIGKRNVICWFDGEGTIPVTFVEDLNRMGVKVLIDYPDLDKTGLTKAARLLTLLQDSDIDYEARRLPGEIRAKGGEDINKLWQSCDFNLDVMFSMLADCEPFDDDDLLLYLTVDDAPKTGGDKSKDKEELDTEHLPEAFKAAIINDVESLQGFKSWRMRKTGEWAVVTCPFHDDRHKSGGFNRTSMSYKCLTDGCVGSLNAKAYGEKRGIILADYFTDEPKKQRDTKPAAQPAPKVKIEMVSDDDLSAYYTDSYSALLELEKMYTGQIVSRRLSRPFPFTTMHSFGGFAHVQEAGKLVYITGVSGGSKTSFAECIVEPDMKNGDDAVWFGPEWNAIEMRKRSVQRNGGLTFTEFSLYEMWLADKKRGVPPQDSMGRNITEEQYQTTYNIIQQLKLWGGRVYQLNQHPDLDNMTSILATVERIVDNKRKAGRAVRSLFFDYIQRAPKVGRGEWDRLEMAVNSIKSLCERLDLFGYILVQPTKGDSKSTRDGNDLTEASAQGLSDQQANLYLTLTPEFDHKGNKLPFIKVRVVKNNLGSTGMKYLKWAQRALTVVDEEVEKVNISKLIEQRLDEPAGNNGQ